MPDTSSTQSFPFRQGGRPAKPSGRPARRRFAAAALRAGLLLVAMGVAFLAGGSMHFVAVVMSPDLVRATKADGIVVLTGGRDRVQLGVDLLEQGRGRRLLISGVNPATTAEDIRRITESRPNLFKCCVDLGKRAETTIGNATETAQWTRQRGLKSVIVVTSSYHMPRALTELQAAAPQVVFVPHAVKRPEFEGGDWYRRGTTLRLLSEEYLKYILARLRTVVAKPATA